MEPPVAEQRSHEYHYTKLGRWTYFGQWTPQESSIDVWNTTIPTLADKPTLAKGPPWEIENRCLEYCYTILGRWTFFCQWPPPSTRAEMPCMPLHKTWQMNLLWPMDPPYQSRDSLNISTQNLADEPPLANGPPTTRAEMPWIPVHKTWQMNLHWPMDPQGNRAEMPSHCYWHLLVKNGNFTLLLTSTGQEWHFHIATDILWSRIAISHCYWHLLVKNSNFTLLLTSTGHEWHFHIATDIYWSRMAISHCYWHLLVKNSNFTLLLTSSCQEWQFHITADIYWSRMAISHCYWHLVVKNGNFTLLLTSSGQEWQLADLL